MVSLAGIGSFMLHICSLNLLVGKRVLYNTRLIAFKQFKKEEITVDNEILYDQRKSKYDARERSIKVTASITLEFTFCIPDKLDTTLWRFKSSESTK